MNKIIIKKKKYISSLSTHFNGYLQVKCEFAIILLIENFLILKYIPLKYVFSELYIKVRHINYIYKSTLINWSNLATSLSFV